SSQALLSGSRIKPQLTELRVALVVTRQKLNRIL
ncbi:MAG: hypothetical protein RLZZ192_529, partial [Pseudomonadota bacterium]